MIHLLLQLPMNTKPHRARRAAGEETGGIRAGNICQAVKSPSGNCFVASLSSMHLPRLSSLRPIRLFAFVVLAIGGSALAQGPKSQSPADQEWAAISNLNRPAMIVAAASGRKKTQAEIDTEAELQKGLLLQASQRARKFYTDYPTHGKASEARKMEVTLALRLAPAGDPGKQQAARAQANAFRQDKKISDADRFDVALAVARMDLSQKMKEGKSTGSATERVKIGADLAAEFGDTPALQNYYAETLRRADVATGLDLAKKIKDSPKASKIAKAEADAFLARGNLIGGKLPLKLRMSNGGELDLSKQEGKTTVVVVWSPTAHGSIAPLHRLGVTIRSDTQLVYLAVGGNPAIAAEAERTLPVPGCHCRSEAGAAAKLVGEKLRLEFTQAPFVYVMKSNGIVAGFGRLDQLPALLALAKR